MFRFTIRDVLWLTVVVALGFGWGVDHWRLAKRLEVVENWRHAAHYFAEEFTRNTGCRVRLSEDGHYELATRHSN